MLRYVPAMSTLWRVFAINGCWILSKACIYWDDYTFLFFNLLIWCITLIDLQIRKGPCITGVNPLICLIMVCAHFNDFNIFLKWACQYFVKNVYIYVQEKLWSVIFVWYLCLIWHQGDGGLTEWVWNFLSLNCLK